MDSVLPRCDTQMMKNGEVGLMQLVGWWCLREIPYINNGTNFKRKQILRVLTFTIQYHDVDYIDS